MSDDWVKRARLTGQFPPNVLELIANELKNTAPDLAELLSVDMSVHQHKFVYAGVRYAEGKRNRPGSGAKTRHYAHWYFCESCLESRVEAISSINESSYEKVRFNATPGEPKIIVPSWDQ